MIEVQPLKFAPNGIFVNIIQALRALFFARGEKSRGDPTYKNSRMKFSCLYALMEVQPVKFSLSVIAADNSSNGNMTYKIYPLITFSYLVALMEV